MRTPLALLLGGALGAAVTLAAVVATPEASASGARCKLRYGFLAECDRPFYAVGEFARVTLAHYNFSPVGANGTALNGTGPGCSFRITIEDGEGNPVFTPVVACPGVVVPLSLPSGGVIRGGASVPLTDDMGVPLGPGYYRFRVFSEFHGPNRATDDFLAPLGNCEALIPFRIE